MDRQTLGFSVGRQPNITMQNLSRPGNNTIFQVGDSWQITITNAAVCQPVSYTGTANGIPIGKTIGTTDVNGAFTLSGQMHSSVVGTWFETWYVGDQANPATSVLSFTVLATIGGQVTASGVGLAGVTVTLGGSAFVSATTGADGSYVFSNLPVGPGYNYSVKAALSGYNFGSTQNFTNLSSNQTANFAAAQYLLTAFANPAPGGTVSLSGGQAGWYNPGDSATVTAIAASGYEFSGFGGALSGITNPRTITITAPASVMANFTPIPTTTVTSLPANLVVTVDLANCTTPCTFQWLANTTHSVTAANQSGSGVQNSFTLWSDGLAASHTITASFTVATYTATFATQYQLTTAASPSAAGGVTLSPPGGWYSPGAQVGINATTNSGWVFTGFSGGLSGIAPQQAVTVTGPVSVTANFAGDFSVSAPNPVTVMAGSPVTVAVSVNGQNGFNDTVTFDPPTLPTGATASFSSLSVTGSGSTNMTINAPSASGNFPFAVRGTSANVTRDIAPTSVGVGRWTIINPPVGYQWSCTTTPGPSIQPGTATVTLTLPLGNCTVGSYRIPVDFTAGGVVHEVSVQLNVGPVDAFWLSSSQLSQTVAPGSQVTYPIQVNAASGYSNQVTFNNGGLTPGCGSLAVPPASVYGSGSTSFTLNTTGCATGFYPITVVGTGSYQGQTVSASMTVTLTIGNVPDFSITASPSLITLAPGVSDVYTVQVNSIDGFGGNVALAATTTAPGTTVQFVYGSSVTGAGRALLQVKTAAGTSNGTYPITVTGASGSATKTWPLTVTVAAQPDLTMGDLSIPTVPSGGSVSVPIPVTLYGRTLTKVSNAIDLPSGLDVTFDSSLYAQTGVVVMNISARNTVPAGNYAVMAESTDDGGGRRHCGGPIPVGPGGGGGSSGFYVETSNLTAQPMVLNDNQPKQYGPYYAYSPGGTPAQREKYPSSMVSSCSVGQGVQAVVVPSQSDSYLFDIQYTAAYGTPPGDRTLSCIVGGYRAAPVPGYPNQGVSVYDGTPHVGSATLTDFSTGTFTITGSGFGSATGTVVVCALQSSTTPCSQTTDFTIGTVIWGAVISAVLTPNVSVPGSAYCAQVISRGANGNTFLPAPGNGSVATSNCQAMNLCTGGTPGVIISTRPMGIESTTAGNAPYYATLTAHSTPSYGGAGTYTWSADNSGMIQFDNIHASTVHVTILGPGRATIRVDYMDPCGRSAPTDSLTFVVTDDITVIAWIDSLPIQLPSAASPALVAWLADPVQCHAAVGAWVFAGNNQLDSAYPFNVDSDVDRRYANAFLYKYSSDPPPPSVLLGSERDRIHSNTALFRGFSRFQAYYEVNPQFNNTINTASVGVLRKDADVGATPDSCFAGGVMSFGGEAHPQNKSSGAQGNYVWSLTEFRVGPDGQASSAYLNKRGQFPMNAMPWVWAVIQLDSNGKVLPLVQSSQGTAQIFPTYWVYSGSFLSQTVTQLGIEALIALDATSSYHP